MGEVSTIGLDIAKQVFHVHGADERGVPLFSRKLSRSKLLNGGVRRRAPLGEAIQLSGFR